MAWAGPGAGNAITDPKLTHIPQLSETVFTNWADAQVMWNWFGLQHGSPAAGLGPNGTDAGAVIPTGVSISGIPAASTSETSAVLHVGVNRKGNGIPANFWPEGAGYTEYKWRLDTNEWNGPVNMDIPITLTNLAPGIHAVEVSGLRDSGWFQDDPRLGEDAVISTTSQWTVTSGLEISSIRINSGKVEIHFNTDTTHKYSLWARESLDPTDVWQKIADVPLGVSGDFTFTENDLSGRARFYQLVSEPSP
jgi:hypothetical protein